MSIVQVIIDRTTSMIIEGIYEFDRLYGGTLIAPSDSSFPTTPIAREWFWRTDESKLYRRNNDNNAWDEVTGTGMSETQHKTLRHLIHFIDNGPGDGFASGAYRETTGTVFPSSIIWYDKVGVGKKKIVSKEISWSGPFPTTIVWKVYDESETLLATVSDSITYSGPFETSRLRNIS
jgi:hypothetical protein